MSSDVSARARRIGLLLLDVDGVLTDGRVTYTEAGDEIKRFHVRDGSGLKLWQGCGLKAAVLSGRSSKAVSRRAAELGLSPVVQGRPEKLPAFRDILTGLNLAPEQVCAVGDDLPDLPVLMRTGLAVAVGDACAEVKEVAHYTTAAVGGAGAVREAIEWLLRMRGDWDAVVAKFRSA